MDGTGTGHGRDRAGTSLCLVLSREGPFLSCPLSCPVPSRPKKMRTDMQEPEHMMWR